MRTYLKEIVISLLAVFIMIVAIVTYIKSMQAEKATVETNIYTLVPSDVNGMLMVNRPGIFSRMILAKKLYSDMFSADIPPIFLSMIEDDLPFRSVVFSSHPDGVVCYIQDGAQISGEIDKYIRQNLSGNYDPIRQEEGGVNFFYFPDATNRFFGCYTYNGIWVGSYSKRLLEKTADQQLNGSMLLPSEMTRLIESFDVNAPLNIIFPADDLNLYVSRGTLPEWRIRYKWLGADLFLSEGNFCCYGSLPFQSYLNNRLYKAMGDTLSHRIKEMYPFINLTFQVDVEEEFVYYTGCTPLPQ